ncbi:MAG: type II toxin-antitoxin system VapC family toxin [Stenotrophobium sp.]
MAALYLDTSALFKLVIAEQESESLGRFLAGFEQRTSSALAHVELARGLLRLSAGSSEAMAQAAVLLRSMFLVSLDAAVLMRAASLPPPQLRSLDALHLASALSIPSCAGMVTYGRRLITAAAYHGLQVWSPGA